ncbi:hypothetical protein EVB97_253 [Rhizobium phage RHph_Y65]|uniref:Uncharacterized protein n=1 Tax=Rhizobium phage RHph_Y65 TaxID=2509785 RepID=A0A7S5RC57_9CAUD|nr:hypothetical protein PQC17_gp253 [Rhizobium phage RHph_Y65]QIG72811.1 hypothetical protein EVB97_253 [Rhizobium phage RHph_Y65]
MNLIFLDFDGVLNSQDSYLVRHHLWNSSQRVESIACPDITSVRLVEILVDAIDARIVISSSWRSGTSIEDLRLILRNEFSFNYSNKVIGKTRPHFYDKPNEIRGDQIQHWMKMYESGNFILDLIDLDNNYLYNDNKNYNNIDNYIILDDDSDMLECQMDHFVRTDFTSGFNFKSLQAGLRIVGMSEQDLFKSAK